MVAGETRQATTIRPAAVAIHDDADVSRHRCGWRNRFRLRGGCLLRAGNERHCD
jgi:hypothetical protein